MKELGYGKREEGVPREVSSFTMTLMGKFLPPELKGATFLEWDRPNGRRSSSDTQ